MNSKTLKFAVSALAIGSTMVACSPSATAFRTSSASKAEAASESGAAAAFAKAQAAVKADQIDAALTHAEKAVELSPSDVGYRMLLADLYLKNGHFASAETTFEDVLALEPGNVRAGLNVALVRIAQGRTGGAIGQLDELRTAPPADLGLAYALAGEHARAVAILEPAARAPGAAARVRQNLALAYALGGDWQKAKLTASQDISPDQLDARMEQWAKIAQPRESWDQVAALLGVTPRDDAGQPTRLALAPRVAENTALAAAEPVPAPEPAPQEIALGGPAPEAAPAVLAETATTPVEPAWVSAAPAPERASQPEVEETRPVYAAAVESLVTPQADIVKPSVPALEPIRVFEKAPAKAKAAPVRAAAKPVGNGRFVVQLGAFGSASGVERAWASAYKRYGFSGHTPLSTTVKLPAGTFHRLSVAGFQSHGDATRVCKTVKSRGGVCFVRAVAGDAPARWASRYAGRNA